MNPTVQRSLDAQLATLTRVQDVPTGKLAFGRDLLCVFDLDPQLGEVNPDDPRAIVQAVIRRYITPRGGLLDDPDYGLDIRAHCNRGVTQRELRALAGAMQGEAQKDDRVEKAAVSLTADSRARALSVKVEIVPADPSEQAFTFTFAVDSAEVLRVTING